MKFTCTQENLNQGLQIVQHATTKNVNLPILNNVLIELKNNNIKLSATNLEIGITCLIRGKIEAEGTYTVNAKLISDYINLLPKENINLNLEDNQLDIKCSKHQTKIIGLESNDYPIIPQLNKKDVIRIDADKFKKALNSVLFAVSKNESRPELNGVLFKFEKDILTLAATDSYRLAEKKIKIEKTFEEVVNTIVPAKTLQEVSRILTIMKNTLDDKNEVEIYINEGQILFVYNDVELISRLIEGNYPDYEQIIPQKHNSLVITSVKELIKNIKTVSLFVKDNINDINLQFNVNKEDPIDSSITVKSFNEQLGESSSDLGANITGIDNNIILNYLYLLEGLNNLNSDEVKLEVIDNLSPMIISSMDDSDQYVYIVMPIRQ